MSYQQLLDWIKAAGFEQWGWVAAVIVPVGSLVLWLFKSKDQKRSAANSQTFNSARGATSVGQQIGGTGHTVIQNNTADIQLVNTLLDRISAKDKELGNNEASLKAKDCLLGEKDVEIQQLRRLGVQSVFDAAGQPTSSISAKEALLALQTGDIGNAQSLLRSLEDQSAGMANPRRREAAQLAREQGALWLGRDVEKAYVAFERANSHLPGNLPTLGYLTQIALLCRGLTTAWHWADLAMKQCEKLAASDPKNSDWQRDLSVSFNKVAGILEAQGEREKALIEYQKSLAIREKLAASDPKNSEWQTDLVVSAGMISGLVGDANNQQLRVALLQRALAILARLKASGALRANQQDWSQMIQQRLDNWK